MPKADPFADFEQAAAAAPAGRPCLLAIARQKMTADQLGALDRALADRRYTQSVIAKVLDQWGVIGVSAATVARHRPDSSDPCRSCGLRK